MTFYLPRGEGSLIEKTSFRSCSFLPSAEVSKAREAKNVPHLFQNEERVRAKSDRPLPPSVLPIHVINWTFSPFLRTRKAIKLRTVGRPTNGLVPAYVDAIE